MGTKATSLGDGSPLIVTSDDPAALRAQIASTRNEMGETIEELHGRLNPTVLKEQAIEQFHEATATVKAELKQHFQEAKETLEAKLKEAKAAIKADVAQEVTHVKAAMRDATIGKVENMVHGAQQKARDVRVSVTDTITENPIPAALAGIGLAWLFIEGRRRRTARYEEDNYNYDMRRRAVMPRDFELGTEYRAYAAEGDYTIADDDFVEIDVNAVDDRSSNNGQRARGIANRTGRKIANVAEGAASTVSDLAHGARDTAVGAASRARESVGEVAHRAQDAARGLRRGATQQARYVSRRSQDLYRDNPLAVGAAMLAAGTVVGLALPRTKVEDEWMGSARDRVVGKAEELAHTALEKAGDVVDQAGSHTASHTEGVAAGGQRPDMVAGVTTRPLPGLGRTY